MSLHVLRVGAIPRGSMSGMARTFICRGATHIQLPHGPTAACHGEECLQSSQSTDNHAGEHPQLVELGPLLYLAHLPPSAHRTPSSEASTIAVTKANIACNMDLKDVIVDTFCDEYADSGAPLPLHTMVDGPPLSIDGEVGFLFCIDHEQTPSDRLPCLSDSTAAQCWVHARCHKPSICPAKHVGPNGPSRGEP